MANIIIIEPTKGPTTQERVLLLIQQSPEGITIRELSQTLNRPVSMLLRCLKLLMAKRQVYSLLSESGMHLIYYPGARPRCRRQSRGERPFAPTTVISLSI